ncbi:MAG: PHP domain-containing protein [Caldisphaeraceae archaeon]|nr:PHP domain-containing protein [Caldisphaeraceae archaeon]
MVCVAELHSHSTASDGKYTPEEILLRAVNLGLSAIAISDHNTFRGSAIALEVSKKIDVELTVIPANEVRTYKGDVLVLCPRLPYEEPPKDPHELHEWSCKRGCITIAAHPFHIGRKSIGAYMKKNPMDFDAIEVWNSRGLPFLNWPAIRFAEKYHKPKTSGSDAHIIQELGTSPTIIEAEECDAETIISSIKKGRCRPTTRYMKLSTLYEVVKWSLHRRVSKGRKAI